jgi:folate-binding protein YgfZ
MIFDLSNRTQLELTGNDRAKFLHGFCTNDIKGLTPGQGCEAFVCNIQGKVLGHIFVFCTESSLWIDSEPEQEDALCNHLDRYLINEDVQIHRRTAERGDIYVHAEGKNLADHLNLGDANWLWRQVDWLGNSDWLISIPRTAIPQVACRLADMKTSFADNSLWNALRIEAGFPLYGIDITSDNLAQEVNRTARCISFTKGCYLGQEPIARIDALGHVNRELHRLNVDGEDVPSPGTPLLDPETKTPVGMVTSAAKSARTPGKIVALGYLRTRFRSPGTKLVFRARSGDATVTVP